MQNELFQVEKPKPIVLRDYQLEALEEIKKGWLINPTKDAFKNQLLVLATGLGKTICFASIADWVIKQYNGRVLVLAHREELLEQAEEKIRHAIPDPSLTIGREQAANYASVAHDRIVIASVASLGRKATDPSQRDPQSGKILTLDGPSDRLARFPKDHFKLIIIDEAHHATAETYQTILRYFEDAWVLGVTATPKRADKESLHSVFNRIAYKLDIVDATKRGYLAPIIGHRVKSKTDLSGIRTTAGDYNQKDLAERVNNAERNDLIVQTYFERFMGRQAIVFATTVDHARAIDDAFRKIGVSAHAITGDMDKNERRAAIRQFKEGKIRVLTNYGVLTEGFDHESLDLIINARPTKSALLLTQIMGRGTRINPGKTHCDFVEIIDNHNEETVTAAQIFGFIQAYDCCGHSFAEAISECERMEAAKEYFDPWIWKSWNEMHARFEKASEHDPRGSSFMRVDLDNENYQWFDSRYRYYATVGGAYKLVHNDHGQKYILRIEPDALGGYTATISQKPNTYGTSVKLYSFSAPTLLDAAQALEQCVLQVFQSWDILLNLNAPWRKRAEAEACTDKQWDLMVKFKLVRGRNRSQITKAQAMEEISRFFNK